MSNLEALPFEHRGRTMLVYTTPNTPAEAIAAEASPPGHHFVLVHGIGLASKSYSRLAPLLAAYGTVHTIELPGFGEAPEPHKAMSVENFGGMVAAYLQATDLQNVTLIGHSMGTQVVTEATLRVPERVAQVVLIGTVINPRERNSVLQALRLAQDSALEPLDVNLMVLSDYLTCGPRWYLKVLPSMIDYDMVGKLPLVTAPALVIRGESDPIAVRAWSRQVATLLPNGTHREIKGKRHVVIYSGPNEVAAEILRHRGIPELPLPRTTFTLLKKGRIWAKDYAYAALWQLRGIVSPATPDHYLDAKSNKAPVLLLPGVWETWQFLRPIADSVRASGHAVHVLPALRWNLLSIADSAKIVADYLEANNLQNVIIIAHSKGGLIGKYLMVRDDPKKRVAQMIAIAAPFSGSVYARWVPMRSVRIFAPTDPTTVMLGKNLEANSRITSMFGPFDPHLPAGSELVGATNIRLATSGHFRPIASTELLRAVHQIVDLRTSAP